MNIHLARASWSAIAAMTSLATTAEAATQQAPFHAVDLHGGGQLVLRQGLTQRVELTQGDRQPTRVNVDSSGRLIVERCSGHCPHDYELTMEVTTPAIDDIAVLDGGSLRTQGAFPSQTSLRVRVSQGGIVDVRSMSAAGVDASIIEGGRTFTKPQYTLHADVIEGGNIAYWGASSVTQSVHGGGVVTRGKAEDLDKPLSELASRQPAVPATPPTPETDRQPTLRQNAWHPGRKCRTGHDDDGVQQVQFGSMPLQGTST